MGLWHIGTDTLAASRFVVSPFAEATASLVTLHRKTATHPGNRAWIEAHRAAYAERLADDPVTALLVRAAVRQNWLADFLTVSPPILGEASFDAELERIRATPPAVARRDLRLALGGPLPALLDRSDLPDLAADLLDWVWRETVLPHWPRRRRIIEADIVARASHLSQGGWAAALEDLRPGMRWLAGGRLQINAYNTPPRDLSGAHLLFVPVTSPQAWVAWSEPDRYAVIYPSSGALVESGSAPKSAALGALIGPTRATILTLLVTPKSTTQLVALTGQGLGSVGRHLKIMLDSRLVERRRAGRSVLYYRSELGDVLVKAQQS